MSLCVFRRDFCLGTRYPFFYSKVNENNFIAMQGILSASVVTVLYYMLNTLNFTGLFLYLLKISENQMFFDVFGVGGVYKEI